MTTLIAPNSQHGWVSQEAWDAALASKGVVLVTVHGTGDGDYWDIGWRWWQTESPFIKSVGAEQPLSGISITVLPFHWSGANSVASSGCIPRWLRLSGKATPCWCNRR